MNTTNEPKEVMDDDLFLTTLATLRESHENGGIKAAFLVFASGDSIQEVVFGRPKTLVAMLVGVGRNNPDTDLLIRASGVVREIETMGGETDGQIP